MTPADLIAARFTLGHLWGMDRPLMMTEMGRALGLGSADPGQSIRDWERGKREIPGPVAALVGLYVRGVLPPAGLRVIRATQPA